SGLSLARRTLACGAVARRSDLWSLAIRTRKSSRTVAAGSGGRVHHVWHARAVLGRTAQIRRLWTTGPAGRAGLFAAGRPVARSAVGLAASPPPGCPLAGAGGDSGGGQFLSAADAGLPARIRANGGRRGGDPDRRLRSALRLLHLAGPGAGERHRPQNHRAP